MNSELVVGKKLWLWKNGNHYLAFDNPYPCYPNGDPLTLGEPIAVAFLRPSVDGSPGSGGSGIQYATGSGSTSK